MDFKSALEEITKRNEELAEKVLEGGNLLDIYDFALRIKPAPIEKLAQPIIKSGDVNLITHFAKDIRPLGMCILKMIDVVVDKGDALDILRFVKALEDDCVPSGEPMHRIISALCKTGEEMAIYKFAYRYYPAYLEAPEMEMLADGLIKSNGDLVYLKHFAKLIDNEDWSKNLILKLADRVVASMDSLAIYDFAQNVNVASKDKLMKAYNQAKMAEETQSEL